MRRWHAEAGARTDCFHRMDLFGGKMAKSTMWDWVVLLGGRWRRIATRHSGARSIVSDMSVDFIRSSYILDGP